MVIPDAHQTMVIKPMAFICMVTGQKSVVSVSFLSVACLQGEYTSGTWEEKTQEINFADFKFCVSHNYLKQEASENDSKEESEEGSYSNAQKHIFDYQHHDV